MSRPLKTTLYILLALAFWLSLGDFGLAQGRDNRRDNNRSRSNQAQQNSDREEREKAKAEQRQREERRDNKARQDRGNRGVRLDRDNRSARPDRDNRSARPDRDGRFDRNDRKERDNRFNRDGRSDNRFDKNDRRDRDRRFDRDGRSDNRFDKNDRRDRDNRFDRDDRRDRDDRSAFKRPDRDSVRHRPKQAQAKSDRDNRRDDRGSRDFRELQRSFEGQRGRRDRPEPLARPMDRPNQPPRRLPPKPRRPRPKPPTWWPKPYSHYTIYLPKTYSWTRPKPPWYNSLFWLLNLGVGTITGLNSPAGSIFSRTDPTIWMSASRNLSLGLFNEYKRHRYLNTMSPAPEISLIFNQVNEAITLKTRTNPNMTGLESERLAYSFFQQYVDSNVENITLIDGQYAMKLRNNPGRTNDWVNTPIKDSEISTIYQALPPGLLAGGGSVPTAQPFNSIGLGN